MSNTSRTEWIGTTKGLQRRIDNNIQLVMGVTQDANGNPIPAPGIPTTPPTVGSTKVVGIQETRPTPKIAATDATYTIPAGSLSYLVEFSSDFVGTVNGISRTGADQADEGDAAQPNNTLPAIAITRSAGNFTVTIGGAP